MFLLPALGLALGVPATPPADVHALPTTDPAVVITKAQPPVAKPVRRKATAPKPTPSATPKAVASPSPTRAASPVRTRPKPTATKTTTSAPRTAEARMLAAIDRIPGYPPGGATWTMTSKYGSWGVADWWRGLIYISPTVPADRMYDVVVHEWSHVLSVRSYPSNTEAKAALNRVFGGTGLTGAERAADCMARQLGAKWTNYTTCTNAAWKAAAAKLIAGVRV